MVKRGVFGFGFVAGFTWGFPSCLRGPLGLSPTAAFATLKIHCSQGGKESVFLPFEILFLFIEELFLSDQGFSRCMYGLAECSGQVKVCGLVTLGV
jgi:hypothetical protein